ncbi:MAG: segregation/condensation protein A [Candidatus Diapherotrites archaeon]|nr:segregation/condensation protein A [Candidatus Diapherotrites archaeon]
MNATQTFERPPEHNLVDLIERPAWKSILIDLIASEQMDPWSIDLVELAEKYLQKVNALQTQDLRIPANAILCAAILLKLKSRVLKLTDIEDEEDILERQKMQEEHQKDLRFVEQLPELKTIHKIKEGRISLDELVDQIESMLSKSKKTRTLNERSPVEFQIPINTFNIDQKMQEVFQAIADTADSQGLTTFTRILPAQDVTTIVETFIPLLFLFNKEKINAWQDEFFGEIFISIVQ